MCTKVTTDPVIASPTLYRRICAAMNMSASKQADEEGRKVFLGGLAYEAREDDLANYELGEHEGRVRSIEDQIAGLGDPMRLKQVEAAKMNSAVPHVGKWVYEQVGGGSKEAAEAKARHFLDTS